MNKELKDSSRANRFVFNLFRGFHINPNDFDLFLYVSRITTCSFKLEYEWSITAVHFSHVLC